MSAVATLRRFIRERPGVERCDLCGTELSSRHPHLVDIASRRLVCACDACAVLFSNGHAATFQRVPSEVRRLSGTVITDGQWDTLAIPIGLAFFFYSSPRQRVIACYPGPAGATESLLPLDTWNEIVDANPALGNMRPDVEALLVNRTNRTGDVTTACYLVPIDECYRLVGLIRSHWRGFSGGAEAWDAIDRFFAGLADA